MARSTPTSASLHAPGEQSAEQEAAATASYIAGMATELSRLAARANLELVAYFLNLARAEAEIRSRELGGCVIDRKAGTQSGA